MIKNQPCECGNPKAFWDDGKTEFQRVFGCQSCIFEMQGWKFNKESGRLDHPNGFTTSWFTFVSRKQKWEPNEWGDCFAVSGIENELVKWINETL